MTKAGSGELDAAGLRALRAANVERQALWCPEQIPDLSFRGNELAGEVGEVCNVVKKLERERLGWIGSRDTVAHLAEELADVVICADLVAISAGIDLDAAVIAKFNATSEKVGLPTRLAAPVDHPEVVGVKIKPLEWSSEPPYSVARSFTGLHYATEVIWPENGKSFDYVMLSGPTVGSKRFASLSDAKVAAQQDFETRIRSALQPSDSPALEAGVVEQSDGQQSTWFVNGRLVDRHGAPVRAALAIPATEDGNQ